MRPSGSGSELRTLGVTSWDPRSTLYSIKGRPSGTTLPRQAWQADTLVIQWVGLLARAFTRPHRNFT